MKKTGLIFTILLLPIDFLMLILAALSAYYLRVFSLVAEIRPVIYTLNLEAYLSYVFLIAVIWLIIFALAGLYHVGKPKINEEISKIFLACSTGVLAIIVAIFLKRELFSSRFIILAAWAFAIIYVVIGRVIIYEIQKSLLKKGIGSVNIILIGNDKNTLAIADEIRQNPKLGYNILKIFPTFDEQIKAEILNLKQNTELDEIVQADSNLNRQTTLDLITFTEENHIIFKFSADIYQTRTSRLAIDTMAGMPIFEIKKTKLEGWGWVYKRIFDVIGSIILLILISPILLITALFVKLESKGPIIYKNKRVGQRGKEFNLFKFRSMYYELSTGVGNPEQQQKALEYEKKLIEMQNTRPGAVYKIGDDPRITKVGKFIRKYSIDELPQFFNVLIGQMSLVGPRPHQPREVAQYQKTQYHVLDIKPGITGMAQISGRSDLQFDEEARLDTYYIENWSLWLDLRILFKTPLVVLFPKRKAL
jgi:exopolysaccharide biosynthesis polyprenyl glycosylphosphotransferase